MDNFSYETIYKYHIRSLNNLNYKNKHTNKRRFICFSGVPGSGKSYLAKKLEKKYNAVRINTDDIRMLFVKLGFSFANIEKELDSYIFHFLKHYHYPNLFFILDASIDRRFKKFFTLLKNLAFSVFIIRLSPEISVIQKRLKRTKGKYASLFIKNLPSWLKDFKKFGEQNMCDIQYGSKFNFSALCSLIDTKFHQ